MVFIDEELCKGCMICVEMCPRHGLVNSGRLSSKGYLVPVHLAEVTCKACRFCQLLCPDMAICVELEGEGGPGVED